MYSTSTFVGKLAPSVVDLLYLGLHWEVYTLCVFTPPQPSWGSQHFRIHFTLPRPALRSLHSVYLLHFNLPGEVSTFRVHFTLPRPVCILYHTRRGEVSTFRIHFTLPRLALRSLHIPRSVHLLHLQLLWRSWHLPRIFTLPWPALKRLLTLSIYSTLSFHGEI